MPKFKIKDIEGIYTNADQNDLKPELVKTSVNFRHKKGYVEFDPRELAVLPGIPNLNTAYPGQGFTWETGIYCTLTNDPFADDTGPTEYNILVLVAHNSADVKARRIWLKETDNNNPWKELSEEADSNIPLSETNFSTSQAGDTFFQIENGILKIYMPHNCFWVGYLDRNVRKGFDYLDHTGWYIDVLVEPFDWANQTVWLNGKITGQVVDTVPPGTPGDKVFCGPNRRFGFKYILEYIENQTFNVDERELTMSKDATGSNWYKIEGQHLFSYKLFLYRFYDAETNEPVYRTWENGVIWEDTNNVVMDDYYWPIYEELSDADYYILPLNMVNELKPSGTVWKAIATLGTYSVENSPLLFGRGWRIKKTTFDAQTWLYTGEPTTIEDSGFTAATDSKFSLITTAVLDDREEIIIDYGVYDANFVGSPVKFAIKVKDIYAPIDINKRVTRFRIYHKVYNVDVDYTLHKEIDLYEGHKLYNASFYLSERTDTGILLASNIGFLYDEKNPGAYQILTGFRSFVTEAGISVGLPNDDQVRVYHSTLGAVLMPDLIYDQNRLPITGISTLNAVVNVNGRFGAFTDTTLYIVQPNEIAEEMTFAIEDTIHLGVKNTKDVANVQGGALINTRNGIYLTNGSTTELISDPINNLVRDYYNTSRIFYNKFLHEVYWWPRTDSEDLYRFRFEDKGWERINATVTVIGSNIDPITVET